MPTNLLLPNFPILREWQCHVITVQTKNLEFVLDLSLLLSDIPYIQTISKSVDSDLPNMSIIQPPHYYYLAQAIITPCVDPCQGIQTGLSASPPTPQSVLHSAASLILSTHTSDHVKRP